MQNVEALFDNQGVVPSGSLDPYKICRIMGQNLQEEPRGPFSYTVFGYTCVVPGARAVGWTLCGQDMSYRQYHGNTGSAALAA